MLAWSVIGVILVVAAMSMFLCARPPSPAQRPSADWMPDELRKSKLLWSEKSFQCDEPVPMVARIDRAYRANGGEIVLVEFKRRPLRRAYLSDVVEMSAQRYVIEQSGHAVSRRGYVVAIRPDQTLCRALPVQLEEKKQVEARAARLSALRERQASPIAVSVPSVCAVCGHRNVCPHSSPSHGGRPCGTVGRKSSKAKPRSSCQND